MDLIFKHKGKLSTKKYNDICNIIIVMDKALEVNNIEWVTGGALAHTLNIAPVTLRKHIQIFREHNDEFRPKHFLIASELGYKYTDNKKEIKAFAKSVHIRATSALAQVDQAFKITKKGW